MEDKDPKVRNLHDLQRLDDRGLLLYQAEMSYRLLGKVDVLVAEFGRQRKINEEFYRRLESIETRVSCLEAQSQAAI